MTSSALALVVVLSTSTQYVSSFSSATISKKELDAQKTAFSQLWETELITRLADLPREGKVPDYRVPYSGHDYPDKIGGTLAAMAKFDQAFYRGQSRAYKNEVEDLAFHRSVTKPGAEVVHRGRRGRVVSVSRAPAVVPVWYGHCNGWTAAGIRHAEPQKSVVRNGVTITPADIKGMLAELYMYSHTQDLGGGSEPDAINPGVLHVVLANWLGRNSHPVAMESALGEPVINFPVHAYKSTVTKLSATRFDVKTLITYTLHTPKEYDKGPKTNRNLYFHYVLDTDARGDIMAGYFLGDSGRIDMLWVPMRPVQGGQDGNRNGNPHLKTDEVLAVWRESVDAETLKKWVNIDSTEEERALAKSDLPAAPMVDETDKPATAKPEAAPNATDPPAATPAPATPAPATATPAPATPAPATPE